jgi:hypothetical protein
MKWAKFTVPAYSPFFGLAAATTAASAPPQGSNFASGKAVARLACGAFPTVIMSLYERQACGRRYLRAKRHI